MILQVRVWVPTKRSESGVSKRSLYTRVHSSIMHNSQEAESSLSTHWQMDGSTKCGTDTQWRIIQPEKERQFWCVLQQAWMFCQVEWAGHQRTIAIRFYLLEVPRVSFRGTENRMVIARGCGCRGRWWGAVLQWVCRALVRQAAKSSADWLPYNGNALSTTNCTLKKWLGW